MLKKGVKTPLFLEHVFPGWHQKKKERKDRHCADPQKKNPVRIRGEAPRLAPLSVRVRGGQLRIFFDATKLGFKVGVSNLGPVPYSEF